MIIGENGIFLIVSEWLNNVMQMNEIQLKVIMSAHCFCIEEYDCTSLPITLAVLDI